MRVRRRLLRPVLPRKLLLRQCRRTSVLQKMRGCRPKLAGTMCSTSPNRTLWHESMLIFPQQCPPKDIPSLTTTLQTSAYPVEPSPTLLPPNTHKICGGGRANAFQCDDGFTCITDPYTPGCGPACDGLGICVEDKICGGFAGFECADREQVCHDDERDDCDPTQGGSDCAGLCVTPHRSLGSDL